MNHVLDQLYRTKLGLAGLVTSLSGVALLAASGPANLVPVIGLPLGWLLQQVGSIVLGVGLFGVIFEYYNREASAERTKELLGDAIQEKAPAIRDAVLHSFAFEPETMRNIASDETLDRIATNAIGLRLDDQALAADAYADLREQVIRSPERWRNVDISVSLSPWSTGSATGKGSMFMATIRWEYRVRPANPTMRFACVSDQAEYRELLRDPTVAGQWYFGKTSPVDPASAVAFELVQFSIDGKERPIRRAERPGAQVYTVALGKAAADGGEVMVSYTYRVLVQKRGHLLFLDLPRPTKGVHVQLDYSQVDIRQVNVVDYFASPDVSRIERSPATGPARTIDVGIDGWVFPRAGVAFVWVLAEEVASSVES